MQIQERGTIGGNVITSSPVGDTLPVLLALDAEAADQLLEHALKLVTTHGFDGLNLRSSSTAPNQLDGSDEKAGVNLVL